MKRLRINAMAAAAMGLPALAALAACGAGPALAGNPAAGNPAAGNPAAGHRPAGSTPPPHTPGPGRPDAAGAKVTGTLLRVGGPAPGAPAPLTGTVTAADGAGGHFTATAGRDGRFRLSLPPGTYRLTGHSPLIDSGAGLCTASRPAYVTRGKPVPPVRVICPVR
jgi:hypothetical protein